MQYYGGKARIGKKISFYIQQQTGTIGTYIEPFCGMCSVGEEIKASRRIFSDNNEGVINLFNALKEGYNPPSFVTESEYKEIEQEYKQGCRSHKTIFVMIASSYSGRLCGGFARDKTGRNYTDAGSRSCIKKIKSLMDAEFFHREYTYYNIWQ